MSWIPILVFMFTLSWMPKSIPKTLAFHVDSVVLLKSRPIQERRRMIFSRFSSQSDIPVAPQVIATGYSTQSYWVDAIHEAVSRALDSLPYPQDPEYLIRNTKSIDFAFTSISSLYDISPTKVVPTIIEAIQTSSQNKGYSEGVSTLIGCTSAGIVSSQENRINDSMEFNTACTPYESEGLPGVMVTLCLFPNTTLETFHVIADDLPDELSPKIWREMIGLSQKHIISEAASPIAMVIPHPSFQRNMDEFSRGLTTALGPDTVVFGATASTVSSLSRAKLFLYDTRKGDLTPSVLSDGCIGVVIQGDVQVKVLVAQGAKPVGPIYRVISSREATLGVIQLDEVATQRLKEADGLDYDLKNENQTGEENEHKNDKDQKMAAYAKSSIPKPPLAEANFLLKTLSDDDKAFMRKVLLIGFERNSGWIPSSPNELLRLQEGEGHRFTVHQVASAGMKDGSVTFPLGSVLIEPGTQMRFFVRDGSFARREAEAIWMGHKKDELNAKFSLQTSGKYFSPTGCFMFPTLDRGSKMFGGRDGLYESNLILKFVPSLSNIAGFFANGIIGKIDPTDKKVMIIGSASCYVLWGSKMDRPLFSGALATRKRQLLTDNNGLATDDEKNSLGGSMNKFVTDYKTDNNRKRAPRLADGELLLRRREIHSGRAMTVSSVEWSVAEKAAKPTSVLEGFMWEKETEVDRLRERVPLSNLISQCKLRNADPDSKKPRDWVASIRNRVASIKMEDTHFTAIAEIPDLKRVDPSIGTLHNRYDVSKLVKQLTLELAPAFSVTCDGIMYGGSITDISDARDASLKTSVEIVPPIMASDLILYPYQLYRLYLSGADAVKLVAGALSGKDLLYLCKISASLQMQTIVSVTSEVQIHQVLKLEAGLFNGIIISNLNLEDYSYDGNNRAIELLRSNAMHEFKLKFGNDFPIIVDDAQIREMKSTIKEQYIDALVNLGVVGVLTF